LKIHIDVARFSPPDAVISRYSYMLWPDLSVNPYDCLSDQACNTYLSNILLELATVYLVQNKVNSIRPDRHLVLARPQ